ncbi:hypothetical protein NMY22_g16964 [Coprinellus aureogranulatus]|nr:hypothetical protein NMY22_g16964 [Coprinellus aureogranulatus]
MKSCSTERGSSLHHSNVEPAGYNFPDATQKLIKASSTTPDITLHQRMVQERLRQLETEICAVKSCHNASTVTCRLPEEILCKIFVTLSLHFPWNPHLYSPPERPYNWIHAIYTCRHWRLTVIRCAPLWSYLNFEWPLEWATLVLQRSKGGPLAVQCREDKIRPGISSALSTALSQVDRIRSLTVYFDGYRTNHGPLREALSAICWTGCAPSLEELQLSGSFLNHGLPERFLHGGVPNLRNLTLSNCNIGWDMLPLSSSLTVLHWTASYVGDHSFSITAEEFLPIVGGMPRLADITLVQVLKFRFGTRLSTPSISDPPLLIPALRSLHINDGSESINCFLRLTRSNTATSIRLTYSDPQDEFAIRQSINDTLVFWCHPASGPKLSVRHFTVMDSSGSCLELDFDAGRDEMGTALKRPGSLYISLKAQLSLLHSLEILGERFDFQTLMTLQGIDSMNGPWYAQEWAFYSRLPVLQQVRLHTATGPQIWDFFAKLREGASPSSQTLSFPSLWLIVLGDVIFEEDGDMKRFQTTLASILRRRRRWRRPILEIHIEESHQFQEAEIATLRSNNPGLTVFWDEYQISDSES